METNPYLKDNEVVNNDKEVILEYEKPQFKWFRLMNEKWVHIPQLKQVQMKLLF